MGEQVVTAAVGFLQRAPEKSSSFEALSTAQMPVAVSRRDGPADTCSRVIPVQPARPRGACGGAGVASCVLPVPGEPLRGQGDRPATVARSAAAPAAHDRGRCAAVLRCWPLPAGRCQATGAAPEAMPPAGAQTARAAWTAAFGCRGAAALRRARGQAPPLGAVPVCLLCIHRIFRNLTGEAFHRAAPGMGTSLCTQRHVSCIFTAAGTCLAQP